MTRTITAMFDSYADAADAVARLGSIGIPRRDIAIISNDAGYRDSVRTDYSYQDESSEAGSEAGGGAALGGALGGGAGLLAGLGLLAIPGLGPVVAAGWLAATAVGAGAGAVAGGLIGSLIDAGVDENDAHAYAEGLRRGGTLVTVRAQDSMETSVLDILDDEGTIRMDEAERGWREEGWSGRFDMDSRSETLPGRSAADIGRPAAPMPTSASSAIAADAAREVTEDRTRNDWRARSYTIQTPVERRRMG